MNAKTLIISMILSLTFCSAGFADDESVSGEINQKCPVPDKPSIPDGNNASEDQMIAAQGHMKSFISQGNGYLECLDSIEKEWGSGASQSKKQLIIIFHNKMVDDMNHVADMFNSAVRAYKGKRR